ncbi:MAG: hypothetical protein WCG98_07505 [bacterium]
MKKRIIVLKQTDKLDYIALAGGLLLCGFKAQEKSTLKLAETISRCMSKTTQHTCLGDKSCNPNVFPFYGTLDELQETCETKILAVSDVTKGDVRWLNWET